MPIKEFVKEELKKAATFRVEDKIGEEQKARFVDANVFIYALARSPKEDCIISKNVLRGIKKRRKS